MNIMSSTIHFVVEMVDVKSDNLQLLDRQSYLILHQLLQVVVMILLSNIQNLNKQVQVQSTWNKMEVHCTVLTFSDNVFHSIPTKHHTIGEQI